MSATRFPAADLDLLATILQTVRDLRSADGENVEYDTALLAMSASLLGIDRDQRAALAVILGLEHAE